MDKSVEGGSWPAFAAAVPARHNELELDRDVLRFKPDVPDEGDVKLGTEDDERELEVALTW